MLSLLYRKIDHSTISRELDVLWINYNLLSSGIVASLQVQDQRGWTSRNRGMKDQILHSSSQTSQTLKRFSTRNVTKIEWWKLTPPESDWLAAPFVTRRSTNPWTFDVEMEREAGSAIELQFGDKICKSAKGIEKGKGKCKCFPNKIVENSNPTDE